MPKNQLPLRHELDHGQMKTVVYPDADLSSLYITQVPTDSDDGTPSADSDVLLVPICDLAQFERAIRIVADRVKKHLLSKQTGKPKRVY